MILKLTKDPFEYRRFMLMVRKEKDTPRAEYIAEQLTEVIGIPFYVESDVQNMCRIVTLNIHKKELRKKWMNKEVEIN